MRQFVVTCLLLLRYHNLILGKVIFFKEFTHKKSVGQTIANNQQEVVSVVHELVTMSELHREAVRRPWLVFNI